MSRRTWRRLAPMAAAMLAIAAIPAAVSGSSTINVPGDFPSIQAAIDAATAGDTVLVAAGTYHERVDFHGKAVTVQSSGGPGATVIDGGAAGRVVNFSSGEGRQSVLRGFTIRNGVETSGQSGAGVNVFRASPTIDGNLVTGNTACGGGGGVYADQGAPLIEHNVFTGNDGSWLCTGGGGGGVFVSATDAGGATAQVIGNTFSGNRAYWGGAILVEEAGALTIADNVISGNTSSDDGGGIWILSQSNSVIVQNLIVNNRSGGQLGGGIWLQTSCCGAAPRLEANTIAGNSANEGSALWMNTPPSYVVDNVLVGSATQEVVYCDQLLAVPAHFDNNDAFATDGGVAFGANCGAQPGSAGNVSADPRFAGSGDLHLQAGSPAIDAGSAAIPDLPATDLDGDPRVVGPSVDLGAYEVGSSPPAAAAFAPTAVDFGTVHSGAQTIFAPVTLTDTGGSPLRVTLDQAQPAGGAFSVGADGCAAATLAPGASCVVQVGFLPGAAGVQAGTLQFTDSAGFQGVPLRATVVAGHAAPSPTSLSFATTRVGRQSRPATATITNDGSAALRIGPLSVQGANAGDFAIQTGGGTTCANATVQVGAKCTVQLVFKPAATGARSASLSIPSDAPGSPAVVPLSGTGG
jgi:hypothetical protein